MVYFIISMRGVFKKVLNKKVEGSIYILVLILVFVATLFVTLLFTTLNIGFLQFSLEKETRRLEGFAASALDRVTTEYLENPEVILADPDQRIYLHEYQICGEGTSFTSDKKCQNESVIKIEKYNKIIGYLMKNGETIQVDITDGVAVSTGTIEVHAKPNPGGDRLLVTAYTIGADRIRVTGSCVIAYTNDGKNVDNVDCTSGVNYQVLSVPDQDKANDYGYTRVRLTASVVSYYRITLLSKTTQPLYLSVTGSDYSDLPKLQQVVFKVITYSVGDPSKQVKVSVSRAVMANPAVPEVFDWVLFNGSSQPIVK